MNEQFLKRLKRTGIMAAVALVVGGGIGWMQVNAPTAQVVNKGYSSSSSVPGVQIGGSFNLTDQNGKAVTEKDYAGQYKLVYFGFTMCPMICPTGLQKIAKALDAAGSTGEKVHPILITVDPERDTPAVMKDYVAQFHPRLTGLTGTKEQIEAVEKSYRVFAAKTQDEKMSDYTMDHSAFTYLMGPNDELIAIYRSEDTADFIAEDLKKKVGS